MGISLASCAMLFALFGDPAARWDGVSLVRVHPEDRQQLERAMELAEEVWSEHPGAGGIVDLAVAHDRLGALELAVGNYEIRTHNLANEVADQAQRLAQRNFAPPLLSGVGDSPFFDDFRSLEEYEATWAELADALPEIMSREQIGVTYEGRKIWVYEISTAPVDAPAVFLNFGQHAREWITPMAATYFLSRLVQDYPSDESLQTLLSQVRIYLVPLVNPDGYEYSWTDDRFWRKNRRPEFGVDLNRNWSEAWGEEPGSSSDPEHGNYRGTGPFSEPETAAMRAFIASRPQIVAHADIHSYSQLVLYPLSYLSWEVPSLQGKAKAWAEGQAAVMSELNGVEYTPLRGSELYPATGVAMDWSFGELDLMSFTYELRPGTDVDFPDGFVLPPEEIVPTCEEARVGILELLQYAADGGPEPVEPPPPNPPEPEDETDEGEVGTGDDGRPNLDAGLAEGGGCSFHGERELGPAWLLFLGLFAGRRRQLKRPSKA
jgi:carboxypeptidase T